MPAFTSLFLTADDFDEIRDRLGNASSTLIPDEVITKTSYLQRAEVKIRAEVEDYQTIIDNAGASGATQADKDKLLHLRVAAIALTAALLVPRIQALVKSQNIVDYSYTALSMDDWAKKIGQLMAEYSNAISQVTYGQIGETPTIMALAGPTRVAVADDTVFWTNF